MKRIYLSILFLGVAMLVSAQSSLDLISRAQLRQKRLELKQQKAKGSCDAKMKMMKGGINLPSSYAMGIIKLADGATEDDLRTEGVNVLSSRHGFAFVSMPVDDVERVASLKGVHRLQLARKVSQKMDIARAVSGIDDIHRGLGLPQAYTGKGVICGIIDGGIDANHIAFRGADGKSRIGTLSRIIGNSTTGAIDQRFYGREPTENVRDIATFTTDDNSTFHGTHTLNTMAGGYKGISTIAIPGSDGSTATTGDIANPYYGVAYDADIAVGCGDLYDMMIAMNVANILDYAEYEKKPVVINMSLGSNDGSHDGKGLINQYLDVCATEDNAIICMASGNEGEKKIALNKTFTAADSKIQTFIAGSTDYIEGANDYARAGQISIYSNDDKPLKNIQVFVYNKKRGRVVYRYPLTISEGSENTGKYWVSSEDYMQSDDDIVEAAILGQRFEGFLGLGWLKDEDSNRFYATIDYYLIDSPTGNADGNYLIGFQVEGEAGQRADCFCNGTYSYMDNMGIAGFDDGSTDGSISDMATGKDVLVVGAYNTREKWAELDGHIYFPEPGTPAGEISSFSSYGTLIDGRTLPHICAPGAAIISASNDYYVKAGYIEPNKLTAKTAEDERTNYWGWAMGTSMATPVVAGSIALWLEADPTLTINDVKEIIKKTAVVDDYVRKADPAKVGYGKFDAYAGLKEVLRYSTGIGSIKAEDVRPVITPDGDRRFRVFLGGAESLDIAIYDITGKVAQKCSFSGDEATLDVSSLSKGIYVISINKSHSQKIVVK